MADRDMTEYNTSAHSILTRLMNMAIAAARPAGKFTGKLPTAPKGRTIVVGAGKAAASMAAAFEAEWNAECEGLVITRYGHETATRSIEVVQARHPVPDEAGIAATGRILELVSGATADDLVIALISGGASSLMTLPIKGVSLSQKQTFTRHLLSAGCPISELNAFRKAISAIKGGGLARACGPARIVTYVISDVPGDDPAIVGSGPTIGSTPSAEVALAIAQRYGLEISSDVRDAIVGAQHNTELGDQEVHVLATAMTALEAAAEEADALGYRAVILSDCIEGEASETGKVLAAIARSSYHSGHPFPAPLVLLSGGETSVTVRGTGRGGRNVEFLLSLLEAAGDLQISALAVDTDGLDGTEDAAGAWFGPGHHFAWRQSGLSARAHLDNDDAYSFFQRTGTLIKTGPTLTNVNDFRAILID